MKDDEMMTAALRARYDMRSDVMYLSIVDAPAVAKNDDLGLVLRYDPRTEEPIGVTIIDFLVMWEGHPQLRIPMVDAISKHLKLPRQPVYEALRDTRYEPRGLSAAERPTSREDVNT